MARIVVNKHISSGRTFVTSGDIQNRGEIIIVNEAGDEGILIRNTNDEIVDITKVVSDSLQAFSGSVVNNYATLEYVDEQDEATLSAATQYTNSVSGNIETKINDLEDRIEELTSGSSATYESIINLLHENYWNSATTQDAINAVSSTTNSQISDVLSIINQEISDRQNADTGISQDIGALNLDLGNLSAATEGIKEKLSDVYHFKGSVNTYEDLPTEDVENGDTYNVISGRTVSGRTIPDGTNYAWTGNEWDELGGIFDFSDFVVQDELRAVSGNIIDYVDGKSEESSAAIEALSSNTVSALSAVASDLGNLSGSVNTLSGEVQTICANTISYIDNQVSAINDEIDDLEDEIDAATAYTETVSGYITTELYALSSATNTLGGEVEVLSGAVVNNYANSADTVSAINEAINIANQYTDEKISSTTSDISKLSGSVITLSGAVVNNYATSGDTERAIGDAVAKSKDYTDEKVDGLTEDLNELSGSVTTFSASTVEKISSAITESKNYTDSVAEAITTALSAVSGTAISAIQDIEFTELNDEYIETHRNIRVHREGNVFMIDVSHMRIEGGDYE